MCRSKYLSPFDSYNGVKSCAISQLICALSFVVFGILLIAFGICFSQDPGNSTWVSLMITFGVLAFVMMILFGLCVAVTVVFWDCGNQSCIGLTDSKIIFSQDQEIPLKHIELGMHLKQSSSTVLFLHHHKTPQTMIRITTENPTTSITLSPYHLIPAGTHLRLTLVSNLTLNDLVWISESEQQPNFPKASSIRSTKIIQLEKIIEPERTLIITSNGKLVVNGILISSFEQSSWSLQWIISDIISQYWNEKWSYGSWMYWVLYGCYGLDLCRYFVGWKSHY